jgi:hypothetical protein
MIKYRLACGKGHEFETWFRNSGDYERQAKRAQIACPHCGSVKVSKTVMAPHVGRRANTGESAVPVPAETGHMRQALHAMRQWRDELTKSAENVGPRFAEEARRIHYREAPARGIYGEASLQEAQSLSEEGITFLPLPRLPEDAN